MNDPLLHALRVLEGNSLEAPTPISEIDEDLAQDLTVGLLEAAESLDLKDEHNRCPWTWCAGRLKLALREGTFKPNVSLYAAYLNLFSPYRYAMRQYRRMNSWRMTGRSTRTILLALAHTAANEVPTLLVTPIKAKDVWDIVKRLPVSWLTLRQKLSIRRQINPHVRDLYKENVFVDHFISRGE